MRKKLTLPTDIYHVFYLSLLLLDRVTVRVHLKDNADMKRGKQVCRILKDIRRQIADANNIEFVTEDCQYKGDCLGTCPKCEAEVRYLEQQLSEKRALGKAVSLLGISLGLSALPAMASENRTNELQIVEKPDTIQVSDSAVCNDWDEIKGIIIDEDDPDSLNLAQFPDTLVKTTQVADTVTNAVEDIDEDAIFGMVESMPEFPDGGMAGLMKFIKDNLRWPENAPECTQGRVTVQFTINEEGCATDPKIIRTLGPEFDKEALRLIKIMPKWRPGLLRGKPAKMKYIIPVNFGRE